MKGKEICKALKEIRMKIAKENDIDYAVHECTFQGECKGTCPRCESELQYLEKELERRKSMGKAVAVVGISIGTIGMMGSLTACSSMNRTMGDASPGERVTAEPSENPTEEPNVDPTGDDRLDGEVEWVEEPLEGDAPCPISEEPTVDPTEWEGGETYYELEGDVAPVEEPPVENSDHQFQKEED